MLICSSDQFQEKPDGVKSLHTPRHISGCHLIFLSFGAFGALVYRAYRTTGTIDLIEIPCAGSGIEFSGRTLAFALRELGFNPEYRYPS